MLLKHFVNKAVEELLASTVRISVILGPVYLRASGTSNVNMCYLACAFRLLLIDRSTIHLKDASISKDHDSIFS